MGCPWVQGGREVVGQGSGRLPAESESRCTPGVPGLSGRPADAEVVRQPASPRRLGERRTRRGRRSASLRGGVAQMLGKLEVGPRRNAGSQRAWPSRAATGLGTCRAAEVGSGAWSEAARPAQGCVIAGSGHGQVVLRPPSARWRSAPALWATMDTGPPAAETIWWRSATRPARSCLSGRATERRRRRAAWRRAGSAMVVHVPPEARHDDEGGADPEASCRVSFRGWWVRPRRRRRPARCCCG